MHKYNPIDELNVAHSKNRNPKYMKVGSNFSYKFENLEKNIERLIELSFKLNSVEKTIFVLLLLKHSMAVLSISNE